MSCQLSVRQATPVTDWQWHSGLVLTAHALRKKSLDELTPNDLRVAFNEDIGTKFLTARVLEVLAEESDD